MDIAFYPTTATIANGAALSGAINLTKINTAYDLRLFGIQMPAEWTTANLTFQVSLDGTTYTNMYLDDGTEYQASVAASSFVVVPIDKFCGVPFLKIRSGTSGTPVNQAADRFLTLALRQL